MASSFDDFDSVGTTVCNLSYPFLLRAHIKVYKNRNRLANTGTVLAETTDYTWTGASQITLVNAITSGEVVTIERQTPNTAQLSPWTDGSNLTAEALNNADLQNLYVIQEQADSNDISAANSLTAVNAVQNNLLTTGGTMSGELAMGSNKITGLADPVSAQDAATRSYVGTALTSDVSGDDGVTITDNDPGNGQIKIGLDSNIATLRDMQTGAATQLKDLTSDELAILDGKTFRNSDGGASLDTNSDTQIPSSKVIAAHVASSQLAIGGFIAIANETKFPDVMPESGVVVSINDAQGIIVNGSGVANQGTTAGDGDYTSETVTITGFPESLEDETLVAGTGLIVTATSTTNTYNYHKLLATETDVKQLSDTINDFHSRFRIASDDPSSDNDDGDIYWNTATNTMRVYEATDNAGWRDLVTAGKTTINGISASTNTGGGSSTFNGVNNNGTVTGAYRFQLNNVPSNAKASQFLVSLDGAIQEPNNGTYGTGEDGVADQPSTGAFSITGNDIIFASPPLSGTPYFILTIGTAVDIGAPSDNTVTNAKIVDNEIAETKLAIHNDPSDNQVLKWGSTNGMEWVKRFPEGTEVNSTGETTTDKWLRTDGDNTCSWQSLPQQPTVTATASGNLAANKPVVIKQDGTVSQISNTTSLSISSSTNLGSGMDGPIAVYDPSADKFVIFGRDSGTNPDLNYQVATVNYTNNTVSLGDVTTLIDGGNHTGGGCGGNLRACYSPKNQKIIVAYDDENNSYVHFIVGSFDSSGDLDFGTEDEVDGASASTDAAGDLVIAAAQDDSGTVCFLYRADNKIRITGIKPNTSNSATVGNNTVVNEDYYPRGIVYHEKEGKYIGLVDDQGNVGNRDTYLNKITVDNNAATSATEAGTFHKILDGGNTEENMSVAIAYMPSDQCVVVAHGDDDEQPRLRVYTLSGDTFTEAGQNTLDTTGASGSSHNYRLEDIPGSNLQTALTYIPDTGELIFMYEGYHASDQIYCLTRWEKEVGSNVTLDGNLHYTPIQGDGGAGTWDGEEWYNVKTCAYAPGAGKRKLLIVEHDTGTRARVVTLGTPCAMNNRFLGFTTAAYNDGDTATIAVSGNTTTQSGLGPGQNYWVTEDGSLASKSGSTSASVPNLEVGLAISSTKLVIK